WFNHTATPNAVLLDCSGAKVSGTVNGGRFPARSFHSGGVNAMTMDGAVHWIGDSIDLQVWQALGTKDRNDTTGSFAL
ncbi:MAG: DUF1559 domain-containing protein, partial [Planctomycetia bacterium]